MVPNIWVYTILRLSKDLELQTASAGKSVSCVSRRVVALPLSRWLGVRDRVWVRVTPVPKLEAFHLQKKKQPSQVSESHVCAKNEIFHSVYQRLWCHCYTLYRQLMTSIKICCTQILSATFFSIKQRKIYKKMFFVAMHSGIAFSLSYTFSADFDFGENYVFWMFYIHEQIKYIFSIQFMFYLLYFRFCLRNYIYIK